MAMYFFHIRDGYTLIRDDDGRDLPDREAVRKEAVASASDLRNQAGRGVFFASNAPLVEVLDDCGNQVMTVPIQYTNGRSAT